jgi:hypothetical protein
VDRIRRIQRAAAGGRQIVRDDDFGARDLDGGSTDHDLAAAIDQIKGPYQVRIVLAHVVQSTVENAGGALGTDNAKPSGRKSSGQARELHLVLTLSLSLSPTIKVKGAFSFGGCQI